MFIRSAKSHNESGTKYEAARNQLAAIKATCSSDKLKELSDSEFDRLRAEISEAVRGLTLQSDSGILKMKDEVLALIRREELRRKAIEGERIRDEQHARRNVSMLPAWLTSGSAGGAWDRLTQMEHTLFDGTADPSALIGPIPKAPAKLTKKKLADLTDEEIVSLLDEANVSMRDSRRNKMSSFADAMERLTPVAEKLASLYATMRDAEEAAYSANEFNAAALEEEQQRRAEEREKAEKRRARMMRDLPELMQQIDARIAELEKGGH